METKLTTKARAIRNGPIVIVVELKIIANLQVLQLYAGNTNIPTTCLKVLDRHKVRIISTNTPVHVVTKNMNSQASDLKMTIFLLVFII